MSGTWAAESFRRFQCFVVFSLALISPARALVWSGYNVVSVYDLPDGSGIQAVLTPACVGDFYGNDISFVAVTAR